MNSEDTLTKRRQEASMLSDYSFSPKKKHHLVIHSGLKEQNMTDEDARTEEVANERGDEIVDQLATSRRIQKGKDPMELVTLDAQIVKMNEKDKKLVNEMLNRINDQKVLITQRN